MEIWQQILTIILTMIGIPAGILIANMCKEELEAGRKWFVLISFFSLVSIIISAIGFLIAGEIAIIPALVMILLLAGGLFFRKPWLFYIITLAVNVISIFFAEAIMFYTATFSFIFLISFTAYTCSFKKKKEK